MKGTLAGICTALVSLCLLSSCGEEAPETPPKTDAELIRETFGAYRQAVLARNAEKVVELVDRNTIGYYDRILSHAIEADSSKVRDFELFDQLIVLGIRQSVPAEKITGMDARALFIYTIEQGMIGEGNLQDLNVGEVEALSDSSARAQVTVHGQPQPLFFYFNRENGVWKIDLTSMFPEARTVVIKQMERTGLSQDEYIYETIELQTGQKPRPDLWQPVGRTN